MIACRGEPELSGVALMRRARRDRTPRVARSRCLDLVPILQFIQTTVWKVHRLRSFECTKCNMLKSVEGLFDHAADRLEKSTERPNECTTTRQRIPGRRGPNVIHCPSLHLRLQCSNQQIHLGAEGDGRPELRRFRCWCYQRRPRHSRFRCQRRRALPFGRGSLHDSLCDSV